MFCTDQKYKWIRSLAHIGTSFRGGSSRHVGQKHLMLVEELPAFLNHFSWCFFLKAFYLEILTCSFRCSIRDKDLGSFTFMGSESKPKSIVELLLGFKYDTPIKRCFFFKQEVVFTQHCSFGCAECWLTIRRKVFLEQSGIGTGKCWSPHPWGVQELWRSGTQGCGWGWLYVKSSSFQAWEQEALCIFLTFCWWKSTLFTLWGWFYIDTACDDPGCCH